MPGGTAIQLHLLQPPERFVAMRRLLALCPYQTYKHYSSVTITSVHRLPGQHILVIHRSAQQPHQPRTEALGCAQQVRLHSVHTKSGCTNYPSLSSECINLLYPVRKPPQVPIQQAQASCKHMRMVANVPLAASNGSRKFK